IGGALGFLFAVWVRNGLVALSLADVSRFQEVSFDLRVLGFTFLIASVTTVLFGLWPAWQASHADVQIALKAGSSGSCDPPFAKALLDKVRAIPGVQSAAISSNGPLMGGWQTGFWREENPRAQPSDMLNSDLEVVAGDYFQTLKVPLVRGRTFNERDTKDSPRVIIIDQAMAEQYFPGEDP